VGKNKSAPARRPVKAKGTIPVPRVGHRPPRRAWYKNRQTQLIGALIGIILAGFAVYEVKAWRDRTNAAKQERQAVEGFNRKMQEIQGTISTPYGEMLAVPEQFKNGQISVDDYRKKAQEWLAAFQRMASGYRSQNPPRSLLDARARLVEAAVLWIDATRTFQLAAQATEPAVRDQAILLASRLANQADQIYTNGLKALAREQRRVGLDAGSGSAEIDTPVILDEDAGGTPPAEPPPAEPAPAPTAPASPAPSPAASP
jgi:type II secretory pathway pseudopilin PulG